MDDLYTLQQNDFCNSVDEMLLLLEKMLGTNIFESKELYDYLDHFTKIPSDELLQRILKFKDSTIYLSLKPPVITEFSLN